MNGKQILQILKREGWEVVRIKGSHHRLVKGDKRTTVPVHGTGLHPKTIASIEKNTGVKLS